MHTPPLHVYSFIHDAYSTIVCLTYAWYVFKEKAGVKIPVVHLECLRAYEEKTKTKADLAEGAVVSSPALHSPPQSPQSPLDSMVLDSPHSPPSASVHIPSPRTRMARKMDTWRENKRRANDEWVQSTMKSLKYEKGMMTPESYKRFRSASVGAP